MEGFEFSISSDLGEGSGNYISEPGIHKGVSLVSVEFTEVSEKVTGKQLIWTFQDSNGAIYRHVEFEPNRAEMLKMQKQWNPGKSKAEIQKLAENQWKAQMSRIAHIVKSYIPEDQMKIQAKSWDELGKKIEKQSGSLFKGEMLDIKLVINNKGRVDFPKYVKSPGFVRNQSWDDKKHPHLVIDSKDNMVKPDQASTGAPGIGTDLGDSDDEGEDPFAADLDQGSEEESDTNVPGHVTGEDDKGFEETNSESNDSEKEESDEDALAFLNN